MTTRRARGEGQLRERADGRWEGRYWTTDGRRRSVFAKTRNEASRLLRQATNARDNGALPAPSRLTVAGYLADWMETAEMTLRPRTADGYRAIVRDHLAPALSRVTLAKLTPQMVQRLYTDLATKGLSAKTIQNVAMVLHRALYDAMRWSLVTRNVAELADAPRVPRREMHALDAEQAHQVLAAAEGEPLEALFVLAITTGLRMGELLGLRWQYIDLDRPSLAVVGALVHRQGHDPVIAEPKSARSRRQVQLTAAAVEALRRHRHRQPSIGFVFAREDGRPLNAQLVNRVWSRLAARAGVPRIRFHDLRHTAATLMLSRGVHPKIVSEMLGHSTVAITLDVYSHVTPTMQREAAAVMDELLARRGSVWGSNGSATAESEYERTWAEQGSNL